MFSLVFLTAKGAKLNVGNRNMLLIVFVVLGCAERCCCHTAVAGLCLCPQQEEAPQGKGKMGLLWVPGPLVRGLCETSCMQWLPASVSHIQEPHACIWLASCGNPWFLPSGLSAGAKGPQGSQVAVFKQHLLNAVAQKLIHWWKLLSVLGTLQLIGIIKTNKQKTQITMVILTIHF